MPYSKQEDAAPPLYSLNYDDLLAKNIPPPSRSMAAPHTGASYRDWEANAPHDPNKYVHTHDFIRTPRIPWYRRDTVVRCWSLVLLWAFVIVLVATSGVLGFLLARNPLAGDVSTRHNITVNVPTAGAEIVSHVMTATETQTVEVVSEYTSTVEQETTTVTASATITASATVTDATTVTESETTTASATITESITVTASITPAATFITATTFSTSTSSSTAPPRTTQRLLHDGPTDTSFRLNPTATLAPMPARDLDPTCEEMYMKCPGNYNSAGPRPHICRGCYDRCKDTKYGFHELHWRCLIEGRAVMG